MGTCPQTRKTTYVHDGVDRLSQTFYPSPTTAGSSSTTDYEQLTYDANSSVTQRRRRDGTVVTLGYSDFQNDIFIEKIFRRPT